MSSKLSKKQQTTESALTTFRKYCGYLLDGAISIYLVLIIAVMPFYNEEGYAHIGTDKAAFFRTVSLNGAKVILPLLAVWLILLAVEKIRKKEHFQVKLSVTDGFALLYVFSLILSYLCSDYKTDALWGALGWYMGFVPQMMLLAIYFLVSRCWKPRKWLFGLFLPVSAVVFLLGIINRFGVYPIDMKVENTSFISTIGNMNWYCGYLVSVFFAGYYLVLQNNMPRKQGYYMVQAFLYAYLMIGFASLITQGSESGIFALGGVLLITFCMSAKEGNRMQQFWLITTLLCLTCTILWVIRRCFPERITFRDELVDVLTNSVFPLIALGCSIVILCFIRYENIHKRYAVKRGAIVARLALCIGIGCMVGTIGMIILNTLHPGILGRLSGNSFFTFNATWGSGRGVIWPTGLKCFAEQNWLHKLVGVGPDCMAAYLYDARNAGIAAAVEARYGTVTLTNAHNEWMTVLIDAGMLGCIGFVGMVLSASVNYLKQQKNLMVGACGLCILAYTFNNIFSFQQAMNTATIYVILGMGECMYRKKDNA